MRADAPGPRRGRALGHVVQRFSTKFDVPLVGDVDLAEVLANAEHQTLKGLFFTRYVEDAWAAVHGDLTEPPPKGKYHAFEAYPMRDYMRLFDHAARARFPGSAREAYRLLGRGEVEVFASSTLGKVTFSMLRDPGAALLRYPDVLGVVLKGLVAKAERVGPRTIAVRFDEILGSIYQVIGVLEGVALVFDASAAIDVEVDDRSRTSFSVSW